MRTYTLELNDADSSALEASAKQANRTAAQWAAARLHEAVAGMVAQQLREAEQQRLAALEAASETDTKAQILSRVSGGGGGSR